MTTELVVLIGPPGAGKSTFANERYDWWEILSSDVFRMQIADGAQDETADRHTHDAVLAFAQARCNYRRLPTVVDATNILPEHRAPYIELAYRNLMTPVGVLFDVTLDECLRRNAARRRSIPEDIIKDRWNALNAQGDAVLREFPVVLRVSDDGRRVVGRIPTDQTGARWLR